LYRKQKPHILLPRCRYEAVQKNLIWHTDLHELVVTRDDQQFKYIIAFIDDASRKILGWDLLANRTSFTTTESLYRILSDPQQTKPYTIWTDNGGEFKGEFEQFLENNGIKHHHTQPYNPQQNGKIERFWQKVAKFGADGNLYQQYIDKYNNRPHFSLPKRNAYDGTGSHYYSPNTAYDILENWTPQKKQWIIDGKVLDFE
jgi:transposase InsO family protein